MQCIPQRVPSGTLRPWKRSSIQRGVSTGTRDPPRSIQPHFNPIKSSNEVLSSISRVINSYGPGGMFKAHQHTPRGQNHLGTRCPSYGWPQRATCPSEGTRCGAVGPVISKNPWGRLPMIGLRTPRSGGPAIGCAVLLCCYARPSR